MKNIMTENECSAFLRQARLDLRESFCRIEAPIPLLKVLSKEKPHKIYEGSDKADGVEIYKPPKRITLTPKDILLPYTPNSRTVINRNATTFDKVFKSPVVERWDKFYVVRDDLLRGGSKSRMIYGVISSGNNKSWVYASPAQGYAQVAIALCSAMCGKKAIIYVAKSTEMHPLTEAAWRAGAEIRMVPMGFLSNVTAKTLRYVQQHQEASLVPFGADHPLVIKRMGDAVSKIPLTPSRVWSICSTGTLSRGLQSGWPKAKHFGVMVGHIPSAAQRGKCTVFIAPERYEQRAKVQPPFPSAHSYDSKVWRFITEFGKKDDLMWNVGA